MYVLHKMFGKALENPRVQNSNTTCIISFLEFVQKWRCWISLKRLPSNLCMQRCDSLPFILLLFLIITDSLLCRGKWHLKHSVSCYFFYRLNMRAYKVIIMTKDGSICLVIRSCLSIVALKIIILVREEYVDLVTRRFYYFFFNRYNNFFSFFLCLLTRQTKIQFFLFFSVCWCEVN